MRLGILGTENGAQTLARHWAAAGHAGSRPRAAASITP